MNKRNSLSTERLIHYSREPLLSVRSCTQEESRPYKPNGLWVSVEGEDDWLSWCVGEGFRLECLACATLVQLRTDANILRLTNASQIDAFNDEFGGLHPSGILSHAIPRWDEVARRYQGILIAPYVYERRLHHDSVWYYAWDCASGCIWDASAIDSLEPLPVPAHLEGKSHE